MKKFFSVLIFNFSLFMLLIIGIQNSKEKSKVSLFNKKTISLPISFIIGSSFIAGSIVASSFPFTIKDFLKKNYRDSKTLS